MAALWLAPGLMLLSAIVASLGSLDINDLLREKHYCHWTALLLSNGIVGCIMCGLFWFAETVRLQRRSEPRSFLFGKRENVPWLLARGLSGGIAMTCAWVAMNFLDIAEANVIMFSNPAWTGLLAWLVFGQVWRWYEKVLCAVAFAGVVLVAHPPFLFGPPGPPHERRGMSFVSMPPPAPPHERGHWVGVGAAFTFAIFLSIASLIINTKLKAKRSQTQYLCIFSWV